MLLKREVIAKKYAQALLSLYYHTFNDQNFAQLIALENFFKLNKKIAVYLSIPTVSESAKKKAFDIILKFLNADENVIKKMAYALLKHRRIEIFDKVLHHLIHEFYKKKNILQFKIKTSHPLSKQEKNTIITFLEKRTKASIVADFTLDKKLITGIRIKGDYLLWERSLIKLLQNIKLPFIQRAKS